MSRRRSLQSASPRSDGPDTPARQAARSGPDSIGLALFVKTPGLSPLKTRLAADLVERGSEPAAARAQATAIYRACLRAVEGALIAAQRRWPQLQPYFAITEPDAMAHPRWARWPRLSQGEGGLGARQATILAALLQRHDAALLLGSDLPWLGAAQLDPALRALQSGDPLVIGPGPDGGYYLLGSRLPLPRASLEQVQYSAPDTLQQLLAVLPAGELARQLSPLADLDRLSDVGPLLTGAPKRADRRQRRLQRHLRKLVRQ